MDWLTSLLQGTQGVSAAGVPTPPANTNSPFDPINPGATGGATSLLENKQAQQGQAAKDNALITALRGVAAPPKPRRVEALDTRPAEARTDQGWRTVRSAEPGLESALGSSAGDDPRRRTGNREILTWQALMIRSHLAMRTRISGLLHSSRMPFKGSSRTRGAKRRCFSSASA